MPRPGVEDRLLSPRRAPAGRHVDGLAHRARCRVLPTIAYPTAFLVQQPGTVARYTSPSQVRTYVISPPRFITGSLAVGVAPDRVGARAPGPAAGTVVRTFRWGCAASKPWERMMERTVSRSTHPRPRGHRAAVMRWYLQGAVRCIELRLDEKGQSVSSGGSRRHPACCASSW